MLSVQALFFSLNLRASKASRKCVEMRGRRCWGVSSSASLRWVAVGIADISAAYWRGGLGLSMANFPGDGFNKVPASHGDVRAGFDLLDAGAWQVKLGKLQQHFA